MKENDIENLIKENKGLIYFVINRRFPSLVGDEDIFQVGMIGLWNALKNFDESKNAKFSHFAFVCIEHEIQTELRLRCKETKHLGSFISLDESLYKSDDGEDLTLKTTLSDPNNPYSEMECNLDFLEGKISDRHLEVLKKQIAGDTPTEIAREYGFTRQWGSKLVMDARKAAQKYIRKEDYV